MPNKVGNIPETVIGKIVEWLPYGAGLYQVTETADTYEVYYRDYDGEKNFVSFSKTDCSFICKW